MFTPNDGITLPPDDTTIWRYMDLSKFLFMLETNTPLLCWPKESRRFGCVVKGFVVCFISRLIS
jgi:hypothetical protein